MNLRFSVPPEQNRPMTQEFLVVTAIARCFWKLSGHCSELVVSVEAQRVSVSRPRSGRTACMCSSQDSAMRHLASFRRETPEGGGLR